MVAGVREVKELGKHWSSVMVQRKGEEVKLEEGFKSWTNVMSQSLSQAVSAAFPVSRTISSVDYVRLNLSLSVSFTLAAFSSLVYKTCFVLLVICCYSFLWILSLINEDINLIQYRNNQPYYYRKKVTYFLKVNYL